MEVALIGTGNWGKEHLRVLHNLPDVRINTICDVNGTNFQSLQKTYHYKYSYNVEEILADRNVKLVIVATKISAGYKLAIDSLKSGKHVLCARALALNSSQAKHMVEVARENKRLLFVGQITLFSPAIRKAYEIIHSPEFGRTYTLYARRQNLPIGEINDELAIWHRAVHDIATFNFWLDSMPIRVNAVGSSHKSEKFDSIFINLTYPNNITGSIHTSRIDPQKQRIAVVTSSEMRVSVDETNFSEPLKIVKQSIQAKGAPEQHLFALAVQTRTGDSVVPTVSKEEPLKLQMEYILESIRGYESNNQPPETFNIENDGALGLKIVRILEAIEKSASLHGYPIEITYD